VTSLLPPVAVGDGTFIYCDVYFDLRLFKGHFEAIAKPKKVSGCKLSISKVLALVSVKTQSFGLEPPLTATINSVVAPLKPLSQLQVILLTVLLFILT